jgi:hypothetical protein
MPNSRFDVWPFAPSSGVFVLPSTTQPALRSRLTSAESAPAGASSLRRSEPCVVTKPAASSRSFTPIGMPASGPGSSPAAICSSIRAASASARSASTATKALTFGFSASIRSSAAWVSSRADTCFARTRPASASTVSPRKSMISTS